jgi:SDR family mycofactocin-dependent oxidoreductase
MGRVSGKVAFVTGAARGQGRAHALRLAEEGADIVAVDVCSQLDTVPYPMSTADDLAATAKLVEERDRRVLTRQVDVRDLGSLQSMVTDAVAEFGGIDILVANAGIATMGMSWELSEHEWDQMIGVNLTGVWKTTKAVIPAMIEAARGGSIILTSSIAGLLPFATLSHYTSAKHGVTGLMRTLAVELAPYNIRVNSVHPGVVNTDMINNPASYKLFLGLDNPSKEEAMEGLRHMNALNTPFVEPEDIANMVLFLASEEARMVTGTTQVVDAGASFTFKIPHAQ